MKKTTAVAGDVTCPKCSSHIRMTAVVVPDQVTMDYDPKYRELVEWHVEAIRKHWKPNAAKARYWNKYAIWPSFKDDARAADEAREIVERDG